MSISRISVSFCSWMNKISPKSQEDNTVIQYGMELLLDNVIKFLFIQLLGIAIGKGLETFVVLAAFCGLRLQAGGIHAKTGWGCGLSMLLIWAVSIIGDVLFNIRIYYLPYVYVFSFIIIIFCVPRTMNIEHFHSKEKLIKKLKSIVVLSFIMVVACFNVVLREFLIIPVILEVLTLLPKNKIANKGESER